MSHCPTPKQLEEFLEEDGSDTDRQTMARHVDRCAACQTQLESLTCPTPLVATAAAVLRRPETPTDSTSLLANTLAGFLGRLKENPPGKSGRSRAGPIGPVSLGKADGKFPTVAGYEIIREVGRGGMGVVYEALQVGLNRPVALKMILAGPHAGAKELERFRQEAEAVARLRHPNIIQIYDVGESEGCPYLALEFVAGNSLAHFLRGTPQSHPHAARMIETLAGAVHYAHRQGIIHRDLKPANILIQEPGVTSAESAARNQATTKANKAFSDSCLLTHDSFAKVTDFGLAKRLDGHTNGTQSGEVLGTPSYMAPEQAASKGKAVGPTIDVYALGAILYELLTGRPPFRGPTPLDTVLQVLHEDPVRPSFLRRDLPRDLETICLKCLNKEPAKRYASAAALADDLQRFRKGKPIQARPVGLHERAWKWSRQRPLTAALLFGLILVAILGYTGITWQWQEARLARDSMEIQRQEAEQARDHMEYQREQAELARRQEAKQRKKAAVSLYFSRIAQAQLQWRVSDVASAEQSLANCAPLPGEEDHRGWEWRYLQGLFHNDLFTLPHGHSGQGGAVAYDPQGARIASLVSGPPADETPQPSEIRIWDARTAGLIHTLAGPGTLHRLAYSPDGKRLALAATDGYVMIWDSTTGKEVLRKRMHEQSVTSIVFSPDGRTVASGSWDHSVKLWDSVTGEVRQDIRGHQGEIQSVAFHPRKSIIASGSWDTTVKLWDAGSGKLLQTLRGHKMPIYCVAFSPDGQSLVSAGSNGNLKIWNLETGTTTQSLTGDTGGVLGIAHSPDGRYLAKAGKDGTVRIWHLGKGVERMTFRGHATPAEAVHFSPDCQRVVSISPAEGVAKVWDLTRHPEYATFARTEADVEAIAFADKGQRLLSVTMRGKLQAWDSATGLLLEQHPLAMNREILSAAVPVSFSADGKRLAARTETEKQAVKVWDTATGAEAAIFRGHTLPVHCVRFSRDGRLLVTCACASAAGGKETTADKTLPHEIKVWEADTGNSLATLTGKGRIFNVALGPDGRWLAWGGQEGTVTLADWKSGQKEFRVIAHQGDVSGVAFSPDGKLLSSAGMEDRTVKIWRMDRLLAGSVKAVHTIAAPTLLCDMAFSPNGRRLAAISRDMVKVWEVQTGHEAITLRGSPQRYWDPAFNPRLAFSPDGTQLAGTNWDESISIWEAPPLDTDEQFAKFQEKRRRFADERSGFWHLQEAELCLGFKNLTAARFHLKLMRQESRTRPVQERQERLESALRKIAAEEK